jgi:hypothetical protein
VTLCETSVVLCATNNYTECHEGFTEFHREKTTVMELRKINEKIIGVATDWTKCKMQTANCKLQDNYRQARTFLVQNSEK